MVQQLQIQTGMAARGSLVSSGSISEGQINIHKPKRMKLVNLGHWELEAHILTRETSHKTNTAAAAESSEKAQRCLPAFSHLVLSNSDISFM